MGEPTLKADADALRSMAAVLTAQSGVMARLDPTSDVAAGAAAMPLSALGAALSGAAAPITQAYKNMADQLQKMSTAATSNANDYDAADNAFAQQLTTYEQGL